VFDSPEGDKGEAEERDAGLDEPPAPVEEEVPEGDNDEAEPPPPVAAADETSESGMSEQQLKRITALYYGGGGEPPMVVDAKSLYKVLLAEGDPPSMSQIQAWLNEQAVNQTFKQFHPKGSEVAPFTAPSGPLRAFSMDLFTATAYGQKQTNAKGRIARYWDGWGKTGGYGLVFIDEYSRMVFSEPLRTKRPSEVAAALEKILGRVETMNGGKQIRYIRSDDGSEFTNEVTSLLEQRGIRNVRTLGSAPQSNGMAERAVSSIRRKMALQYAITGKSWRALLPMATRVHNKTLNRTTGLTPTEAIADGSKAQFQELRANQYEAQTHAKTDAPPPLAEGTLVKLRTAPDSMNKTSKQSFYDNVLRVAKVVRPSNPSRAVRYQLEDAEGRTQSSGVLSTKLYPQNYLNVVGKAGEDAASTRARSNINMLKKGRFMRTVG
jgi:transposase InsO family protein